jgi:hypothetical protein
MRPAFPFSPPPPPRLGAWRSTWIAVAAVVAIVVLLLVFASPV